MRRKSLKSQQRARSSISHPNNIKDLRAPKRNVFLSQSKFSLSQSKFSFRFGVDFDERHSAAKGFGPASRCFPSKRKRRRRLRRRNRFNPASRFLRQKDNRRISSLAKIGPPLPRDPLRLLPPPIFDARVIAGQQHLGNAPPLPFTRARVMGIFEPARLETLLLARFGSPHNAGKQPDAGVEHRERRDLAARKNVVADRDSTKPRAPTIRSSAPSKRGQTITSPGPAAHSRARRCVNGSPRGLMISRGRGSSGASAASRLAASTSARITMPGPPPAGVSSTARWRPRPCSRISRASSDHSPRASASPARERPSGPGNICGNSVSSVQTNIGGF